jgi:biotin carboxylase
MNQGVLVLLGDQVGLPDDPLIAARELCLRTTVLSSGCNFSLSLIDRHHRISLRHPSEVVELACKLYSEEGFQGVLAYDDQTVPLAARIADRLGLPGQPVEVADAARDKVLMKRRFESAGVPIAPYILANGEDDAAAWVARRRGYPVVIKPVRGSASQGVIRANNEQELRKAYRRVRRIVREGGHDTGGRSDMELLVEAYLDGREFSVELLVQKGEPRILCTFEKPSPLCGPFFEETLYITPPRITVEQRIAVESLAVRAVEALGLRNGAAHCEVRMTPVGSAVLEVGARLIGGACSRIFRDILGQDIHRSLLRLAVGQNVPELPQCSVAAGAMMLPVPSEGRIIHVRGVDAARRVDGVRDVIVTVGPGDLLVRFPEQSCYIGYVTAKGETPEAVEESLLSAAHLIDFELKPLTIEENAHHLVSDF